MPPPANPQKAIMKLFRRRKVLTLPELLTKSHFSRRTMQRRLEVCEALNSYNHNGRHYTLPEIPDFDSCGLWHYRDISFSKHGNLRRTLVHVVESSPSGLTAAQIAELLRATPRSFLSHFQHDPDLYREKIDGRFVWFSAQAQMHTSQRSRRIEQLAQKAELFPTDRQALLILLDLLHHPEGDLGAISRRVKEKGAVLSADVIRRFLARHDLLKKTTDSTSFNV